MSNLHGSVSRVCKCRGKSQVFVCAATRWRTVGATQWSVLPRQKKKTFWQFSRNNNKTKTIRFHLNKRFPPVVVFGDFTDNRTLQCANTMTNSRVRFLLSPPGGSAAAVTSARTFSSRTSTTGLERTDWDRHHAPHPLIGPTSRNPFLGNTFMSSAHVPGRYLL